MVSFNFNSYSSIGFSGSRNVVTKVAKSTISNLSSSFSGQVLVGCASGIDLSVRAAFPSAIVFRSAGRQAFQLVQRSIAFVQAVQAASGLLVAFPSAGCPSGVVASSSFNGRGSGTWGCVALALGLGVSVVVYCPCSPVLSGLSPIGGCPGWFSWSPSQLSLF